MITIKDIAKRANVSVATVSRVVNNGPKVGKETRERIKKMMDEMGYRPNINARALVTNNNDTIGLVIPEVLDPFFAALAHGIDEVARENSCQLLISTGSSDKNSEKNAINLLQDRRCERIIFHSKHLSDQELIELSERISGLVLINRYIEELQDRSIWLDNYEGGKIAARHLMALQHKSIAIITSNYDLDDPKLRLKGIVDELRKQSIEIEPDLIVEQTPDLLGGEKAAQALVSSGKMFSAIFSYNDAMAIGAISTLEDNGFSVPKDISIIGFDDVLLSRYSRPKLSTLSYPIIEMAKQATHLSISLTTGKTNYKGQLKYLPKLVRRESTTER